MNKYIINCKTLISYNFIYIYLKIKYNYIVKEKIVFIL